ncbi:MAG: 3-phosphoserine/phosphohydroxythreonine transaminase [bacterium]|nr:3-phosphoserine/phosphohydroxythreonine transaminase [bacterium]
MARVFNFSAGPAMLPEPVLKKAAEEMLDYKGSGMSVMEMSHRSKPFEEIINGAEATLREIMGIPDTYYVLFLQGGASMQFAMVPLNLFENSKKADFVNTGTWSKKAISEAKKYGTANVVASSEDKKFAEIPVLDPAKFSKDADFFHITTNNTIEGTTIRELPDTGAVPLVADMSSNILGEQYDVAKFGLIYAGAQKNIGPAGVTVVIIKKDLVGSALPITPTMLDYKIHAENGSLYNTPPCYAIYISKLVFEWIKAEGGVKAIEARNKEKAAMLYNAIDNSKLYKAPVANPKFRSIMNVPFALPTEALDEKFLAEAKKLGLTTLKGHRSVGGCRASIYNAMPVEGVKKLVEFMKNFEINNKV